MKINLGVKPYLFPMPVLMIATYGEDDRVNVMNMAWGGICDDNKVALNISDTHKTADNLRARRAFTRITWKRPTTSVWSRATRCRTSSSARGCMLCGANGWTHLW